MSTNFQRRVIGTIASNTIQASAVCGFVYLTDRQYWNPQRLSYIAAFWMGVMMPIKVVQFGVNRMLLARLDLPNYNFFYLTNPKALFYDVSINHLVFPFVQVTLLFNYMQHGLPSVFTPKAATSAKFDEIKAKHSENSSEIKKVEQKKAQDSLKDIVKFRIHLAAVNVFFDAIFPRFNMGRQKSALVTDLTQKGKKINTIKTYMFTFIWNTYCIDKYFDYHH